MATNSFKDLIGKKITQKFSVMGQEVVITKLTVEQVLEIQGIVKENEEASKSGTQDTATQSGLALLRKVIRMSVAEAAELTDEEFAQFPMDELNKLSAAIMKFSGFGADAGK